MKTFTKVEKPEKFLKLTKKDTFLRLYAFEMSLIHLTEAKKDKRKREKLRAQIAIDCINKWLKIAGEEYESNKSYRDNPN